MLLLIGQKTDQFLGCVNSGPFKMDWKSNHGHGETDRRLACAVCLLTRIRTQQHSNGLPPLGRKLAKENKCCESWCVAASCDKSSCFAFYRRTRIEARPDKNFLFSSTVIFVSGPSWRSLSWRAIERFTTTRCPSPAASAASEPSARTSSRTTSPRFTKRAYRRLSLLGQLLKSDLRV